MTKQILKVAIVLAVFAAMSGTAFAGPRIAPDASSTSVLLIAAVGGMGVVRKFIR